MGQNITKDFYNWEDLVVSILENEYYNWNFKYLSTLTSINWCDNILKIRTEEWDWDYLSENSKCFSYNSKRPKDLIKHIEKFEDWLNFAILSKRKDVKLDIENISTHLSYPWDWNAISQNKSFALTADFVMEHKDFLGNGQHFHLVMTVFLQQNSLRKTRTKTGIGQYCQREKKLPLIRIP